MARSLNKAILIGNLTRDPEMKYTPSGTAVCTFGLATNRQWKTESGDQKDEAEFHNLVAWQSLAEICAKMLKKGMKVYVEGRLQTRSWQGQDGAQKQRTEIVISDMIILDSKKSESEVDVPADFGVDELPEQVKEQAPKKEKLGKVTEKPQVDDDIPF
ncbi:MAG: single-stranded DNA-binding protein [Patescibacteria group bacterium]